MSAEPGRTLAHYTLLERIGEGGMGVVYKALDTRLNRHVAIKILRPELTADPDRRRGFLREARAAAAVTHPGIATVHEVDEADGIAFIVMELVDGRPLSSMIRDQPLSATEAVHIAIQLADAMARAHEARVIHRDLKPDNILIGADRRARILDFGLARVFEETAPASASKQEAEQSRTKELFPQARLLGTASYMSPEQARGEEVDARSDIFSFGVTLYEMLAGRPPFVGTTITATLAKILETEPEPLGRVRADLPADLSRVVERCLRKDAAERFPNASELASALRTIEEVSRSGGKQNEAAPLSRSTIAVFPFSFRGSAEFAYLSAGLVDLLSTKLDGAGELKSVDPHVILCCDVPRTPGPVDPEAARAAARRYGAGLFVLGGILELGGQLHLDASLYDGTMAPTVLSKAAVRGEAARIFEMVDQLTAGLLAKRPGGPGTRLTRIAAMATDSFEALKAYLEGEAEMRAMRRVTAVEAYRRAVSIDPEFALAWYRLSVAALWSGQSHIAHEAARNAVERGSRLSERDRDLLAAFDASLRGVNEEAERRYRMILGTHPDDVEAWYQLGELQMHGGPVRGRSVVASREAWERLIHLDPKHVNGWAHLGLIAASLGERETFESCIRHVLDLSPTGDSAVWVRGFQAFSSEEAEARAAVIADLRRAGDYVVMQAVSSLGAYFGDYAGACELAGLLTEPVREPEVRALGHAIRSYFELARGRRRAATHEMDLARSLSATTALLHEAHFAASPRWDRTAAEIESLLDQLERLRSPAEPHAPRAAWIAAHEGLQTHLALYLAGVLEARLGRPGGVLARAARLDELGPVPETGSLVEDLVISLRARAAWADGDVTGALATLETGRMQARFDLPIWSPFHSRALDRFARGELLDLAGRRDEALRWFDSFLGNSIYDQIYVAPSHLRRAEICERLGLREKAAGHYARAAQLWRDGDPDLRPTVEEALARVARLRD